MEKLDKNDARKVDSKTLQYLRDRAIKLRESGVSNIETASILGLSKITTSRWYSKHKKDGQKALKVQKTGRPKKNGKRLRDEKESTIISMLIDTTPEQLKWKYAIWTSEAVKQVILRERDVDMPIST